MSKKFLFLLIFCASVFLGSDGYAQSTLDTRTESENLAIPFVDMTVRSPQNNQETALSIQLILLLAIIALSPSIIVLMTSFLRLAIVFDFIKRALSLQSAPPNQVVMGIALFLSLFIMWPTLSEIYNKAYIPYTEGELTTAEMIEEAESPIRLFMYRQMAGNHDNIALFMRMGDLPKPNNLSDVPTHVLIPAFILNELTVAFKIGILIFLPFIVIDLIVASILMSMGMIMLPPVMISMPFKIALFVMVDGWTLLTQQLMISFR